MYIGDVGCCAEVRSDVLGKWRSGLGNGESAQLKGWKEQRRYGRGRLKTAASSSERRLELADESLGVGGSVAATKVVLRCYLDKDGTGGCRGRGWVWGEVTIIGLRQTENRRGSCSRPSSGRRARCRVS